MLELPVPSGPQPRTDYFPYGGGLDMVTPDLSKSPGALIECNNWEIPAGGGYRRIGGYERYDGRDKPSDAGVSILGAATTFNVSVSVGDTVNGATSGETAVVIYIDSGRTYLAVTKITGNFTVGENVRVGVTVVGVMADFTGTIDGDHGNYLAALAAAEYRQDITEVPGAGPVRGVIVFDDDVYAWRDNVGGTACVMHKATTGGWAAVTLAEEVYFTNANTSVGVGDTLTQGGVTATIRKVVVQTGTLLSGTNTGKLVISGRAGGNFAAGAASSTGGGSLTLDDAETAQSFSVGGTYGFREHNFYGSEGTAALYGWNGATRAFEWDGTYLCFIDTGLTVDKPEFGEVHLNQLWLSYQSSVMKSVPGDPMSFDGTIGAQEFAVGAQVTGLASVPGTEATGALAIFTKNRTFVMYGKTDDSFDLITALPEVGARAYTIQNVRDVMFLDDLGLTSMAVSDKYGNFGDSDLSAAIKPWLGDRIDLAACSVVVRKEGQYKLFLSDGSGITVTFSKGVMAGICPFRYEHIANVACESEKDGGMVLFGATDGFVYEINRGRSFDGETIVASRQQAFNHVKSPYLRKRMRRFSFEVDATGYHTITVGHVVGRYDPEVDFETASRDTDVSGGSGGFDATDGWDTVGFDGSSVTRIRTSIDVTSTDISVLFLSSSDQELPFTMTGQSMQYTPRRLDRR